MAMLYLRNKPIGAISSGASGGGHTIENPSGTDMTQRSNLQFTDADVTDDSTNDRTEISIVRKLTQAEFDELTPEEQNMGVIVIKDANPIYVPSNNAVSVTADGVKTYATLLNELYALVDKDRIGRNSILVWNESNQNFIYHTGQNAPSGATYFERATVNGSNWQIISIRLQGASKVYMNVSGSISDVSSSVASSGITITLYYNTVCTDRNYTEIPDVFYKDIDVSGTVCSNYYALVSTGVLRADYLAIGFAELNPWDENITYSIGGGTTNALLIRSKNSSYTISANKVIRVFFVKTSRLTPLT